MMKTGILSAIIVASVMGGILLVVAITIVVRRCTPYSNRRLAKYRSEYKTMALNDTSTRADDFEVLFEEDMASKEDKDNSSQVPTAVIRTMVVGDVAEMSETVTSTIGLIKSFTKADLLPGQSPQTHLNEEEEYSKVISNPLLDDGLGIIVCRSFIPTSWWTFVWEKHVSTIVDFDFGGENSLWPSGECVRVGDFDVVASMVIQTSTRVVRNIFVRNIVDGQSRSVTVFGFRESSWSKPYSSGFPTSNGAFTDFVGVVIEARQHQDGHGPIVLMDTPLMPIMSTVLFAFDAIACNTVADMAVIIANIPRLFDETTEEALELQEEQINFCSHVILEDIERSFSALI